MDELDTRNIEWRALNDDLETMRWRTERMLALGYELREADLLAHSTIDIHELERLIGKGCPPATAVRIAA